MVKNRTYVFYVLLLFFMQNTCVLAQYKLSGTVRDLNSGSALSGANVFFEGSRIGTSTNSNGYFEFTGLQNDIYVLAVSHIGYCDSNIRIELKSDFTLEVFLSADSLEFESIIVTASRTQQLEADIPQQVYSIRKKAIQSYPSTNTDNLLKMVPGLVVNRSWGIFSRNAAVSMRGMPGSNRSLILLDGIPLNKTSGGTVNWHLVTPEEIEKIEVVKGPGSALYGMNAMGGVINMITSGSHKKFGGTASAGYGSYNTIKGQFNLHGNQFKEKRGVYWKFGAFYREGDGYVLEPEDSRTQYSSKAYLQEVNASALLGYQFSLGKKLEVDYRFYTDKRGSGTTVNLEDGSFESFTNHNIRSSYDGFIGKTKMSAKGFYLMEGYERQNESVNSSGEYKLTDTETNKTDAGLWLNFNRTIHRAHSLSWGLDIKYGSLDNQEIYRTSTDEIYTEGDLFFTGIFLQDEMSYVGNKLKIVAAIRIDHANFYNGGLQVNNPTSKTGFVGNVDTAFSTNTWAQLSPKLSVRYNLLENLSIYASAASGFMPPRLDDLVGSRKIRRGFKVANPELTPEVVNNIETGVDWIIKEKFILKPAIFYSRGYDFQYLVATGEYIDSGSEDPVPVYQRQNVSKVEVGGLELGVEYNINTQLKLLVSYAYNQSEIIEYNASDNVDITGRVLNEVPDNLIFVGLFWYNRIVNLHINYTYTDDQWYDEENTEIIPGYSLVNLRISKQVLKKINLSFDVQDLLDEQYIDRKGYLSPGRFMMLEVSYQIK